MIRIMLVDDEHLIRAGLKSTIEKISAEYQIVAEAANGYEAKEKISFCQPDIVVLDIKMPGISGIELGEWIKKNYPEKYIVFLSGYAEFSFVQSAIRLGAVDYILKPTRKEQVETVLQKIREQIYKKQNREAYTDLLVCQNNQLYPKKDRLEEYGICIFEEILVVKNVTYRAVEYINRHYAQNISLIHLSENLFINQTYLSELFKKETHIPFAVYGTITRLEHARVLILNDPHLKVYEIAQMVGMEDSKYFSQVFKKYLGVKPSEYRAVFQTENNEK
ncbi:response regulator transcription factor [Massiliimalia timonensis]|uniref:response regulator transcription factor n=1 Tax=Massiliimalia timonensis TaxID=1987501 RepID=UPI000B8A911E|nr:response regulator [Massiliimalia timonensis]